MLYNNDMTKESLEPSKQGKKVGYGNPPKATQFGQPNGNPRHNGVWKKEDTPRYKLELMMKMSVQELTDIVQDANTPLFDIRLATAIKDGNWKILDGMINQVYGAPKQTIEQTNLEPPKPLADLTKKKK